MPCSDQPPGAEMPVSDQDQVELGDLKKGDVGEGVAMLLTELENELGSEPGEIDPGDKEGLAEFLGGISSRSRDASEHNMMNGTTRFQTIGPSGVLCSSTGSWTQTKSMCTRCFETIRIWREKFVSS